MARHGAHHVAQKSTTTGISDFRTSASKVASVTVTGLAHRDSLRGCSGGRGFALAEVVEVVLGVERGGAAGARGGDRLAVAAVDQVAAGEDSRDVGRRRPALHRDVSRRVGRDDARDEFGARVVADRDEQARRGERRLGARVDVPDAHARELRVAVEADDLGVPLERGSWGRPWRDPP